MELRHLVNYSVRSSQIVYLNVQKK